MSRSSTPKHSPAPRSNPTSVNLAALDTASVIENIKQTALPKEVTFGLYFSYQR
ncbi:hypothetical protein [Burkholderia vietnamiensis]|uniref:hypothetical protein n=1 Tax=Burkholderia vietnamiensis TaxID=60552 RepID=UPI00159493C9|nr:hypothetical protein [Burkholderia vietnamiensis]